MIKINSISFKPIYILFIFSVFILLCGCELSTPTLPPIDKESFSYNEVIQQKQLLDQELANNL